MRDYDLLVVGELNPDLILKGNVDPEFGQVEKLVDDFTVAPGGSSSIFAASAVKMGLKVLYASRVGDDVFGHYMIDALQAIGIDTRYVTVDPEIKTGATVILSRGEDRAMLTYLGSLGVISQQDVDPAWFSRVRHLHVASPFLLTGLRPYMPAMMRQAKEGGMTVSLDTNWDPDGTWRLDGLFDHLDVFLPNDAEIMAIAGKDDLDAAIDAMAPRVPVLAVKRGGDGATGVQHGHRIDVPAYPVEVKDTTGAGDTFDGGFLAAWLAGKSLQECLRFGAACGGLTTTIMGGFNGQPSWDEAEAYIRAHL
ncbi:MAG: carbohydrate kinase family protein [Anaerolineae bacterium]|jgi:ribokinase